MQSCSSSLSTGLLFLTAYVLLVSTLITVTNSQPLENTSQMKSSGSDTLGVKLRHLIRRAVVREHNSVFCNPFGGCKNIKRFFDEENDVKLVAGDHVRPEDQERTIQKRVFCNSYGGCRSFKRFSADDIRKAEIVKQRHSAELQRRRRVFCNSFGGCQS